MYSESHESCQEQSQVPFHHLIKELLSLHIDIVYDL